MTETSQSGRLLHYLQNHPQGILNTEMREKLSLLCYTKRVSDLRADGHHVLKKSVPIKGKHRGVYRYYLEAPELVAEQPKHQWFQIFKRRERVAS